MNSYQMRLVGLRDAVSRVHKFTILATEYILRVQATEYILQVQGT